MAEKHQSQAESAQYDRRSSTKGLARQGDCATLGNLA